jgi:2,3-bisphosphoglycerate-independent phosphoglycerate mutase
VKYLIVVPDGAADRPDGFDEGRTPLEVADMPVINELARRGEVGFVQTIPFGVKPGSDAANLSVMGYDPAKDLTGRSPLEVVSMGIDMKDTDVSFRVNLVTLASPDGEAPSPYTPFEELVIIDHAAGDIPSADGNEIVAYIDEILGSGDPSNEGRAKFYPGVSYRNALIVNAGQTSESGIGDVTHEAPGYDMTPPHDILGKAIGPYLPSGDGSAYFRRLMKESFSLLREHPVNVRRRSEGKRTADAIWIWGQGRRPALVPASSKYGVDGTVVAAVDLIKGIGICAGLEAPDVKGATGTLETDFSEKARVAIRAFESGKDFVFLHVEAPDECSHQGDSEGKVESLGLIDREVVAPIVDWLSARAAAGEEYRVLIVPDHRTPLSIRTHSSEPVPFVLFDSSKKIYDAGHAFSERSGKAGLAFSSGAELAEYFFSASANDKGSGTGAADTGI